MQQPSPTQGRPNLLYIVHRFPYPPDKGDRIRAFQILRYLASRAAVHLLCFADELIAPEAVDALRKLSVRVGIVQLGRGRWLRAMGSVARGRTITEGAYSSPACRSLIREWTKDTRFQACLISASSMVPYLRTPELHNLPAVIDLVDVDSQKWLDYANASFGPRNWLYRMEGRRLRRLEAHLPSGARAVTLVSEAEAELFRRFCGPGRVEAVTNGVDLEYFQPQNRANRDGCVFLGALDYRPNVEGITWFCREVWPLVLQVRPDARIRLVGRRPTSTIKSLARLPGVELIGQVPDVRPFVAGANVAVVPLQIARGVQNKILESLAMEVATVVSPSCLKGLRAQPGKHLLVASSAKEWVEVVQHLLEDRDLGNELGRAGRDYVMQHHRWDQCLRPMDALLDLPAPPTTIEALGCGDASNAALATAGRQ